MGYKYKIWICYVLLEWMVCQKNWENNQNILITYRLEWTIYRLSISVFFNAQIMLLQCLVMSDKVTFIEVV